MLGLTDDKRALIPRWILWVSETLTGLGFCNFCYPNYSDGNCCRLRNKLPRFILNAYSYPLSGRSILHLEVKKPSPQDPGDSFRAELS